MKIAAGDAEAPIATGEVEGREVITEHKAAERVGERGSIAIAPDLAPISECHTPRIIQRYDRYAGAARIRGTQMNGDRVVQYVVSMAPTTSCVITTLD